MKTDKNLGPAIIEKLKYIRLAYRDHLNDTTTYRKISLLQATNRIAAITRILRSFVSKFLNDKANEDDKKFLERSLAAFHSSVKDNKPTLAKFYLLAKVHKSPLKSRPIVSVSGSITEGIGCWVDKELQKLFSESRHLFPYFLKSSRELVADVTNLDIPPDARFFTCDAVSMYTNIDTAHALQVIGAFIASLPDDFYIHPGLLTGLEIVMTHCVFQFGPDFFVQLTGTAMGAPPAPMYATMYFAVHENNIIQKYHPHLQFYRRYIDDGFGIWIANESDDIFKQFQQDMDKFGRLRWEFSPLTTTTTFLDVSLKIENTKIVTTMHEKLLNLYLYIPPHSAHAPGVLKSIIFGRVQQVHYICNNNTDVRHYIQLLFNRLCARGYSAGMLQKIFVNAMSNAQAMNPLLKSTVEEPRPLFLHVKFHPLNPPSTSIQRIFQDTLCKCSNICNHRDVEFHFGRLIVAYHRPTNIANRFSVRKLMFTRGTYGQITL